MSVRQLKGITPLFQQILTKQAGKVMDALSEGNLGQAYWDLKILVSALKEQHRTPIKQNEFSHIEALLAEAGKPKSKSFYRGLIESSASREAILAENMLAIFEKLMDVLHEEGYLEKVKEYFRGRFQKRA